MTDESKRRLWERIGLVVPVALLCASLAIIAWLVSGSFVSYTPAKIDADAMRTLYLERTLHFGSAIALLNALAIVFLLAGREFGRGDGPRAPPSE
jgi:hypothetical protein